MEGTLEEDSVDVNCVKVLRGLGLGIMQVTRTVHFSHARTLTRRSLCRGAHPAQRETHLCKGHCTTPAALCAEEHPESEYDHRQTPHTLHMQRCPHEHHQSTKQRCACACVSLGGRDTPHTHTTAHISLSSCRTRM